MTTEPRDPGGEPITEPDAGPIHEGPHPGETPTAEAPTPRLRWSRAPHGRQLPAGEVQIRAAVLDRSPAARQALGAHLSSDELRGIAGLRRPTDQRRRLVCRGLLRKLLGRFLEISPDEVSFEYGSHGKPELAGPQARSGIHFNLSHSGALALFAFARDVEVGVDVEARRPLPDLEKVAGRFFSGREIRDLLDLPEERRTAGFYNAWTRKEAFVKAVGAGLSQRLSDFAVTLKPEAEPRLLLVGGDRGRPERWSLAHLEPAPGFVGAVAVPTPHIRVRCWA